MDAVDAIEVRVVFAVVLLSLERRVGFALRDFRGLVEVGTIFKACLSGLFQDLVGDTGGVFCGSFRAVSIGCSIIFVGL